MASQPQSPEASFSDAFERLKLSVSTSDAEAFQKTSLQDVLDAAQAIETEQRERRSLRNLRRIEPFLSAIEKYSGVIEVLCQGTPYLPWIWVRFSPSPECLIVVNLTGC